MRAPSQRVWDVLGDFGNEHVWTRTVKHCSRDTQRPRVGTVRTCTLPKPLMGRTHAREELVEFEPGAALGYKLEGSAGPFATAASRWSTRPSADGGTIVTVEGRFTAGRATRWFLWPLTKPMLGRLTAGVLRELDAHVTQAA